MKTTQSGFEGFIQDKYTNLKPVTKFDDRILCTEINAYWGFEASAREGLKKIDFARVNAAVVDKMLSVWGGDPVTGEFSRSLQETTYKVGSSVLNSFSEINDIVMETPNVHFYTYPLEQFGIDNPNVVFQSTDCHSTASGRIVTRMNRKSGRARL